MLMGSALIRFDSVWFGWHSPLVGFNLSRVALEEFEESKLSLGRVTRYPRGIAVGGGEFPRESCEMRHIFYSLRQIQIQLQIQKMM